MAMAILSLFPVVSYSEDNNEFAADPNTFCLFHFNEGSGNMAKDEISGKYVNLSGHQWGEGVFGKALVWNETNGIGTSPIPINTFSNGFTVEYRLRIDRLPSGKYNTTAAEFDYGQIYMGGLWQGMKVTPAGNIGSSICFNGEHCSLFSTGNLNTGKWAQIAFAYDPKLRLLSIYIDGKLDNYIDATAYPEKIKRPGTSDATPFLGLRSWAPNQWKFVGAMDELRISDIVRPEYEKPPLQNATVNYDATDKVIRVKGENKDKTIPALISLQINDKASERKLLPQMTETMEESLADLSGKTAKIDVTISAGDKIVQKIHREIQIIDARPRIYVKNGVIYNENKAFFPILMYFVYPEQFEMVRKINCNTVYVGARFKESKMHGLPDSEPYVSVMKAAMNAAQKNGLFVLGTFGRGTKSDIVPKLLDTYKDNTNILMYYIADEPQAQCPLTDTPEWKTYWGLYKSVKEYPGAAPAFMLCNNVPSLEYWSQCGDILAMDPYVERDGEIDLVQRHTKEMNKIAAGKKGTIAVLKAYNYNHADADYLLYDELRTQVFVALAEGARGIGYYTFDERPAWYMPDHPELMNAIRMINTELIALNDILLAPDSKTIFENDNSVLSIKLRDLNGKLCLIAANAGKERQGSKIKLDASIKLSEAKSILTATPYTIKENIIEISLPRFGADVIQIE